ncbi:hypothetical protein [Massilia eburnea]|uniref:hypothetical protein n=1 Tax=Massilia eburnea TaxID=1776165 RepID=UPI003D6C5F18
MAQRLRKTHVLGKMFEALRRHYGTLSDYTHGHHRQLSRWLSKEGIGPRYSREQMAEILRFSDFVGLLAAILREKIAERPIEPLLYTAEALLQSRDLPSI